jgi:hypothetical protein
MALFKATILALDCTKKPPSTQNLSTNHYTTLHLDLQTHVIFLQQKQKCTCAIPVQKYLTY